VRKRRVLLTASYGPHEPICGEDQFDIFGSRLARGHYPFSINSIGHPFGLYLIAENISHPTTVLEHPHWDEFVQELKKGYDVVGFQLTSINTPKIARMIRHIRKHYPGMMVVVGGYGILTLDTPVPADINEDAVYIRNNADHLCREEGVGFMRSLLGDTPVDREITQFHIPPTTFSVMGLKLQYYPSILVALGCPNACDFCCTSAAFNHKKIYVAEPEQTYRFMKHYQKSLGQHNYEIVLYDEDLFTNPEYIRELGRLLKRDRKTWGIRYIAFGSMRSLAPFEPDELHDCGICGIWIGVESLIEGNGCTKDHYQKRVGRDIIWTFRELHRRGIQTTASLILGFDFHTRENLRQDIDDFVAMKPTTYQISPLTPCPGTKLYAQLAEEDRILDTFTWEKSHLLSGGVFKFKNLKKTEIKEYYDYAHERLRSELGPPALQFLENALDAYQLMKDSSDEYRAYQASQARRKATQLTIILRACKIHHESPKVRTRAEELERRYRKEIGSIPVHVKIAARIFSYKIKKCMDKEGNREVVQHPPSWTYYNTFDDRVWIRKGRKSKKPVPYKGPRSLLTYLINRF